VLNYPRAGKSGAARWLPSWRLLVLLVALVIAAVAVLFGVAWATTPIPDPDDAAQAEATSVYFADGQSEIGEFATIDRDAVPLEEVAPTLPQAVISSEDRSFYTNRGVSPRGITRALWNNLRGNATQGGSTLTQQYVERYFMGTTTSLSGKFREAIIALKIDQVQSKEEILENYLNTIYFGRGAYGVERAAEAYFDKPASELTLSESALLAGIIPAPSAWDPAADPETAEQRWNRVLNLMVEDGYITQAEREEATFPETIEYHRADRLAGPNGYLLDLVRTELLTTGGFTEGQLDQGGLTIVTTIDPRMQQAALDAVHSLPASKPANMKVALVSVDPATGAVKALYGGEDFVTQPRNNATQDRAQGGSTFKPFTLIAALENGKTLDDRYLSYTPMEIPGFDRPVRNFDRVNRGPIDLIRATANSVNTVYAQLNVEVGPEKTVDVATRAGVPADTPGLAAVPANVLGPASPHPADMATAYATFAAGGVRHERFIVASVKNQEGAVLYTGGGGDGERVFDAQVIADATYAMTKVVEGGTGRYANQLDRPAAGKTGSSQDYRSAWFCGFVPQLATVVAMYQVGEDGSEETLTPFGGVNPIAGGTYPTRVWTRYMTVATEGMEVKDFPARSVPSRAGEGPTATPTPTPTPTQTAEPTTEPAPQGPEGTVPVPPVTGMDVGQAQAAVQAAGLVPTVQVIPSELAQGTVISTNPGPGTPVAPGASVTVTISGGLNPAENQGDRGRGRAVLGNG
jgi:membrane peptidoglycan carboxypeptidase